MDIHNHLLIRKTLEGDKQSFLEIVENHKNFVFALALAKTGHPEKAGEEMVTIFQLLYSHIGELEDFHGFLPFLANLSLDYLKKAYPQEEAFGGEMEENMRNYFSLLWEFPLENRLVFLLNFCTSLGYAEIGNSLNISENRVRGILAKMIKTFVEIT